MELCPMRMPTIVVVGSMVALLTACSTGSNNNAAPAATTTAIAPSTVVSVTKPTVASFRADMTIQQAGLGLLALTNTGKRKVTVQGWPTLTFRNAADEPLAVPTHQVKIPGAGPSITIRPGETAFAGVKWASGDKGSTSTYVATSIELTPPGATDPVNVNIIGVNGQTGGYTEFDLTSVQVGTLQPAAQGVLVF
jgi:hypothetical protein